MLRWSYCLFSENRTHKSSREFCEWLDGTRRVHENTDASEVRTAYTETEREKTLCFRLRKFYKTSKMPFCASKHLSICESVSMSVCCIICSVGRSGGREIILRFWLLERSRRQSVKLIQHRSHAHVFYFLWILLVLSLHCCCELLDFYKIIFCGTSHYNCECVWCVIKTGDRDPTQSQNFMLFVIKITTHTDKKK